MFHKLPFLILAFVIFQFLINKQLLTYLFRDSIDGMFNCFFVTRDLWIYHIRYGFCIKESEYRLCIIFAEMSNQNAYLTEKPTEKPTEIPTEKPTVKIVQKPKKKHYFNKKFNNRVNEYKLALCITTDSLVIVSSFYNLDSNPRIKKYNFRIIIISKII